jgi:hypothetical protein
VKKPCLLVTPPREELIAAIKTGLGELGSKVEVQGNAMGQIFVQGRKPILVLSKPEALREVERLADSGWISDSEREMLRRQIQVSVLYDKDLPPTISKALHEGYEGGASAMGVITTQSTSPGVDPEARPRARTFRPSDN